MFGNRENIKSLTWSRSKQRQVVVNTNSYLIKPRHVTKTREIL